MQKTYFLVTSLHPTADKPFAASSQRQRPQLGPLKPKLEGCEVMDGREDLDSQWPHVSVVVDKSNELAQLALIPSRAMSSMAFTLLSIASMPSTEMW